MQSIRATGAKRAGALAFARRAWFDPVVRFAVVPRAGVGLAVPVIVALAAACTGSPPDAEPSARAAAAITNGADDGADPAVVAIVDGDGKAACSGTVVAPHLVLTAAHCTVPEILQGAHVVFGASVGAGGASIPVVAARPHPQFDPSTFADDIALVVLGSRAPASPVPLGSSAPAVGEPVRVVGYGFAAADAAVAGTKRQGTASVSAVADTTFEVTPAPSQPCDGDSGGPALAPSGGAEAVVGVTSHGDGACAQHAICTRVDAFATGFLAPTMASLADGSAPVGARCLFPEQCSGGAAACIAAPDDPSVTYCTASCGSSSDCPAGMQCASAPGGGSQCRYPTPTPGALGAPCARESDCVDGTCTAAGVCGVRCVPGVTTCPSGFACDDVEGGIDFFCLPTPTPVPTAGGSCAVASPWPGWPAGWIAAPLALALLGLARRRALRRARMRAGTIRR